MNKTILGLAFLVLGTLHGEQPELVEGLNRQVPGSSEYVCQTAIFERLIDKNQGICLEPVVCLPVQRFTIIYIIQDPATTYMPEHINRIKSIGYYGSMPAIRSLRF